MQTRPRTIALLAATLCLAACGDDDESTQPAVDQAAAATTPTGDIRSELPDMEVVLDDPFDSDTAGWGEIIDSPFGDIVFEAGDLRFLEWTGRFANWGAGTLIEPVEAGELDLTDVRVRTTATIVSGGGVIGLSCRTQPDTDAELQWYEFVVRNGYAAIRHADDQGHLAVLAETEAIAAPVGTPVEIEGICLDDGDQTQFALAVDGVTVLEATTDNHLGNGWPGLVAWSFPAHEMMQIHWHEMSVEVPA